MNGVTGRMGLNQHLVRSILAIRGQGGVALPNGDRVMPDPILVGRNAEKIAALGKQYGIARSTTDLVAALKNPNDTIFFDAATTQMRADLVTQAIEAGKHIYCEKPVADSLDKAIAIAKLAKQKGVKNGVFQVDGTHGSAVAGLTRCVTQSRVNTPRPVWNPDVPQTIRFMDQWEEVPDNITYENGFKIQWEDFIRHVCADTPWKYDLVEGAKGVQLAELGLKSWNQRRWVDVPALNI